MDPWVKAVAKYSDGLNETEKTLLKSSTAADLVATVKIAEHAHGSGSKVGNLVKKIQPLVAAIEQYGTALDVLSNANGIQAAQQFSAYFVKLLEMLEHIGDVLPRYGTYSVLFSKREPLQNALCSTYLQIITFCMDARRILAKRKRRSFLGSLWKPFDQEFGDTLAELRRFRRLVEEEARVAYMIESKEEMTESAQERIKMEEERKLAEESRKVISVIRTEADTRASSENLTSIKKWIRGRSCAVELADLKENHLPGTCEWILGRDEVSEWLQQDQMRTLWVIGIPGCGKSVAFSRLLTHLDEQAVDNFYFMFRASDQERNTTSSVVRSWLIQILEKLPDNAPTFNRFMQGNEYRSGTMNEVTYLFLQLLDTIHPCTFAIDALDECADRAQFLRLLPNIIRRHKLVQRMPMKPADIATDINLYISHRLAAEFGTLSDDLKSRIRERLADCQGMFLCVKLMLDHLHSQTTVEELLDALNQLPIGLDATYDSILKAINALPKPRRLLAHKILLWVTIARRPLSVAEIRTMLAIRPGNRFLDENKLVINTEATIPAVCMPLLETRSGRISTVHFTVHQYLERYLEENRILHEVTADYGVKAFQSGHQLAAAFNRPSIAF
ncbi:hypothetical protein AJ80_02435 [Polytolypa hystricis UAMH7299]|uniref:Uncharacterized protein n=1 Tax=Polytolypa hystricis (strain UAMH7299) TaxID=1447883 RepID=A0A2B7YQZ6_POLH7|nr:hypothetical protein AJ80_02435 [Polytolypa hystricis UAMH7299]